MCCLGRCKKRSQTEGNTDDQKIPHLNRKRAVRVSFLCSPWSVPVSLLQISNAAELTPPVPIVWPGTLAGIPVILGAKESKPGAECTLYVNAKLIRTEERRTFALHELISADGSRTMIEDSGIAKPAVGVLALFLYREDLYEL
jgi:hypothetical protein